MRAESIVRTTDASQPALLEDFEEQSRAVLADVLQVQSTRQKLRYSSYLHYIREKGSFAGATSSWSYFGSTYFPRAEFVGSYF